MHTIECLEIFTQVFCHMHVESLQKGPASTQACQACDLADSDFRALIWTNWKISDKNVNIKLINIS